MTVQVRPALPGDALVFAPLLRPADILEVEAVSTGPLEETLRDAIVRSSEAYVALEGSQSVALWGVAPVDGRHRWGSPWLVGTALLENYARQIVKLGREASDKWAKEYDYLINFVHAHNHSSIAWLKHIGYTVMTVKAVEHGKRGELFYPFYRTDSKQCAPPR